MNPRPALAFFFFFFYFLIIPHFYSLINPCGSSPGLLSLETAALGKRENHPTASPTGLGMRNVGQDQDPG